MWSLRGNVCDIPTDCPQRERAGWTGDWQVFAPTAAYLYDVLGFTRKWLRDVALDQRADGCVANMSPLPAGRGLRRAARARSTGRPGWGDVVVARRGTSTRRTATRRCCASRGRRRPRWLDFAARARGGRRGTRTGPRARPEPAAARASSCGTPGSTGASGSSRASMIGDFRAFVARRQVRGGDGLPAPLGRDAGAGRRAARASDDHVPATASSPTGARAAWQAEFLRPDGTLRRADPGRRTCARSRSGWSPDGLRAAVADRLVELVAEAGGHLATGFLSTGLLLPVLADAGHARHRVRAAAAGHRAVVADDDRPRRDDDVGAVGRRRRRRRRRTSRSTTTARARWSSFLHRYVAGLRPTAPGLPHVPGAAAARWRAHLGDRPGTTARTARSRWPGSSHGPSMELDRARCRAGTTATVVLPDGAPRRRSAPARTAWVGAATLAQRQLGADGRVVGVELGGAVLDLGPQTRCRAGVSWISAACARFSVHGDDRGATGRSRPTRSGRPTRRARRRSRTRRPRRAGRPRRGGTVDTARAARGSAPRRRARPSWRATLRRGARRGRSPRGRARSTAACRRRRTDTWSTTAMCMENVVVCSSGSVNVFHCGVSEPPTARNPATRGLSTRASTRNGTVGFGPARRSAISSLDDGGVGVRAEQPVAEQLEPGGHGPGDDRRADDEPVAVDETLPQPVGIVRLAAARRRPLGSRSSLSRTSSTAAPSASAAAARP